MQVCAHAPHSVSCPVTTDLKRAQTLDSELKLHMAPEP